MVEAAVAVDFEEGLDEEGLDGEGPVEMVVVMLGDPLMQMCSNHQPNSIVRGCTHANACSNH